MLNRQLTLLGRLAPQRYCLIRKLAQMGSNVPLSRGVAGDSQRPRTQGIPRAAPSVSNQGITKR